jgi:peptidoglycan hydrolase CwlO-like protein
VTQNLETELKRLDDEILEISNRLKAKKKARRKLAGALEQLRLTL